MTTWWKMKNEKEMENFPTFCCAVIHFNQLVHIGLSVTRVIFYAFLPIAFFIYYILQPVNILVKKISLHVFRLFSATWLKKKKYLYTVCV